MAKSIEEKIEDIAKQQLKDFKVKYFTKTESINTEIDAALKNAPSKSGGVGANFPDIKCFVEYKGRKFPIMIEVKGREEDLEKLNDLGEVDNYDKKDLPIYANIAKYAVNGAVHYATAIVNLTESYKEAIAIGFTGWKSGKDIKTEMRVYYVSDANYNVPKLVEGYEDFSFLTGKELYDFIEKIDALYLTEDEKEKLTQKLETQIESNLKKLNQEMRDAYSISEAYRVKLISGMIIAGLGVEQDGKTIVAPLEIDELRSNEEKKSHDGVAIMNKIESFLDKKDIPPEKIELIKTNFEQVFIQTDLYKRNEEGESRLKKVYITVRKDIVPFFTKKKYHLDFTGKLFNVLNDWVKVPDGDQNDVVLTPRYVCDLMVKLCRVNKDSFVWDYAAGSGGFLVAAMKQMVRDADNITDKTEHDAKINSIKMKQLLGVELRPDMYALAVLNMILMGDGSSHILCDDSLKNYKGNYEQGPEKEEIFPADVFLLNPPYSEKGKGFNFVEKALSRMKGGYAAVLIQENAGSGNGEGYTRRILDNNTLVASIKMGDIFCGKSSVQTAIYVFDVGHAHPEKKRVKFIDFTNDGYARQSRKKSSLDVNLRDTGDAAARYKEIVDIVLDCEPETKFFTKENGLCFTDTITTKVALVEPKKKLDKIHERLDPIRKELLAKQKELKENEKALKENEKRLAKAEKDEDKKAITEDTEKLEKLNDKIQNDITVIIISKEPIEKELAAAQKEYDDIFNRIGADWTYGQHRKIDSLPTEADFRKTVADYLSWKIGTLIRREGESVDFL
ncbi:MAG: N-6 DNA methylase [Bacteroidales bacterium]|nr:N-6 DNA methylase [Bacteroidales bacterium]